MKTKIALSVICLAAASAFGGIKDAYTGRFRLGAALGKWVYEKVPNAESDLVAANFCVGVAQVAQGVAGLLFELVVEFARCEPLIQVFILGL